MSSAEFALERLARNTDIAYLRFEDNKRVANFQQYGEGLWSFEIKIHRPPTPPRTRPHLSQRLVIARFSEKGEIQDIIASTDVWVLETVQVLLGISSFFEGSEGGDWNIRIPDMLPWSVPVPHVWRLLGENFYMIWREEEPDGIFVLKVPSPKTKDSRPQWTRCGSPLPNTAVPGRYLEKKTTLDIIYDQQRKEAILEKRGFTQDVAFRICMPLQSWQLYESDQDTYYFKRLSWCNIPSSSYCVEVMEK